MDKTTKNKYRLDMVVKDVQVIDAEKGLFKFIMIPDPRMWEKTSIDGKSGYLHKIDKIFLSNEEMKKAAPTLAGKPVSVENIGIDMPDYLRRSKERIERKK